jgi:hypothetical protein
MPSRCYIREHLPARESAIQYTVILHLNIRFETDSHRDVGGGGELQSISHKRSIMLDVQLFLQLSSYRTKSTVSQLQLYLPNQRLPHRQNKSERCKWMSGWVVSHLHLPYACMACTCTALPSTRWCRGRKRLRKMCVLSFSERCWCSLQTACFLVTCYRPFIDK